MALIRLIKVLEFRILLLRRERRGVNGRPQNGRRDDGRADRGTFVDVERQREQGSSMDSQYRQRSGCAIDNGGG